MSLSNTALQKLSWVLIYGGFLSGVLGLFMILQNDPAGWYTGEVLSTVGGAAVITGVVLIWLRSRRPS